MFKERSWMKDSTQFLRKKLIKADYSKQTTCSSISKNLELMKFFSTIHYLSYFQIYKSKRSKTNDCKRISVKDQIIIEKDKQFNSVNNILSGSVRKDFKEFYLIIGNESVFYRYEVTFKRYLSAMQRALSKKKVMVVKAETIDQLLEYNTDFKLKWQKLLFIYKSYRNENLSFLHKSLTYQQFQLVC